MSQQYCTILSPTDEPQRIIRLVRKFVGDRGRVVVNGKSADWSSLVVRGVKTSRTLNRRVFREAGDEFSRMRLGMWAYFDRVETEHAAVKANILQRVDEFALAIGVVAEPGFVEEAGHYDCLLWLARALDAIIWNGSGVLNPEGQLLLDGEGNCDVAG